jgi:hypothetical protein
MNGHDPPWPIFGRQLAGNGALLNRPTANPEAVSYLGLEDQSFPSNHSASRKA